MQITDSEPFKDPHNEHPIPASWRPTLWGIVQVYVQRRYELAAELAHVAPISPSVAKQIREYIEDYGEELIDLPDEAWDTSVCRWMGTHLDVIVDLWTTESGRSDMVLSVRVFEDNGGYRFEIDSVHVP
jgi:hypothetical protein